MLHTAAMFFVVAVLSAVVAFGGVATGKAATAQSVFLAAAIVFAVTGVRGLIARR